MRPLFFMFNRESQRRPPRPQDAAALSFRKTASPSGASAEGVGWVVGSVSARMPWVLVLTWVVGVALITPPALRGVGGRVGWVVGFDLGCRFCLGAYAVGFGVDLGGRFWPPPTGGGPPTGGWPSHKVRWLLCI